MSKIEVGKEYDVNHARRGRFRIRVVEIDEHYVLGEITQGTARHIGQPDSGPGDDIYLDTTRPYINLTPVT